MMYTVKQICLRNGISKSTFKRKTANFQAILRQTGKRKRFYNEEELKFVEKLLNYQQNNQFKGQ